jgi:hypothetical protein
MTDNTPHPYRAEMEAEVARLSAGVVEMLDLGCETPFDEHVIELAARRVCIHRALELAEQDHWRLLAWLLRRYLRTLVPRKLSD